MFFRFAFGDIQANIIREKVIYLFLRYLLIVYLLLLAVIMKSIYLNLFILLLMVLYILWSIGKNYRYVNNYLAIIYFPLIQIVSDASVILGSSLGILQKVFSKKTLEILLSNKSVLVIILVYAGMMLSVINFGIPNINHPFDYFMDEWHQSQSVRDLFSFGSPNLSGAANGSIFQWFLTGIYLIPFYLLHIVNPFSIKSSVTNLSIQTTLFEVFRLNSLLFGVLSIIILAYITKKYFKTNPFLTCFLFVFNPLWLMLSNYFKYDIALEFWILLAFLFMLRFSEKEKTSDFILAGVFSSVAFSTKLEPLNLLLVYFLIFPLFIKNFLKRWKTLFAGLAIYFILFLLLGVPDIILGKGNLHEYLYSNFARTPNAISSNLNLGMNYWLYYITRLYPVTFGRIFYFGFIVASLTGIIIVLRKLTQNISSFLILIRTNKFMTVLVLILATYLLSLIPLRTGAVGNRLVPLLPLMALVVVIVGTYIFVHVKSELMKFLFIMLVMLLLIFQFVETISWNVQS